MKLLPGDRKAERPAESGERAGRCASARRFTIPNIICAIRLTGSFVLIPIAWLGHNELFLWGFLVLAMSDWIDGKLAILLDQRTELGARLDSWADAALYAALLVGVLMLHGDTLVGEAPWIGAAVATYALSTAVGFWKYRRWPSYHTRAAKTGWFLTIIGAIGLFTGWSLWPMRIALGFAALTNLEALAITLISPVWRANITSVYHAWRDNRAN